MFRIFILLITLLSCNENNVTNTSSSAPVYVSPTIDKYGHFRKGHIRMPVSTNKNAIRNQARSRYYYHTRGKYRSRKKSN